MSNLLSIDEQENLNVLSKSYLGFFHSSLFEQFLNTTQTGFAHKSSGTDLGVLLKALATSLCLCSIQLTCFCFLRSSYKFLYEPRSCCVPVNERMDPLSKGIFEWIIPTIQYSIHHYLSLGLDAYFFVRFISVLLLFFSFVGFFNMLILIPINLTGSSQNHSASGLDRLSLSNIVASKVVRLNAHFLLAIITVALFHWLLVYELNSFVKIRQSYLLSDSHNNSIISRTLLVTNVPNFFLDTELIHCVFGKISLNIRRIWFLYDFEKIKEDVTEARKALHLLEAGEIQFLRNNFKSAFVRRQSKTNENQAKRGDEIMKPYFYPPINIHQVRFPGIGVVKIRIRLPGVLRALMLEKKVPLIEWCVETLEKTQKEIDSQKLELTIDKLKKHDKLFIEFQTQREAYIAHQCLLYREQEKFKSSLVEVHPGDILWENLIKGDSLLCAIQRCIVNIVLLTLIVLYVVPVSFIGLVSQIPLLTSLMPFLRWIYFLPIGFQETISSLLPSILLSILTEMVMVIFRLLTYFKGEMSGCNLEINLQQWYFVFLFVQQFLVVTISSSLTSIFKQIVDSPTSIPILLALDLPKAATFFFKYFSVKALAFCGSNFLRIDQLIAHHTLHKFLDKTPRQKFSRLTCLPKIRWGTTYPVYSVYASIGLAYCIISPLITVFVSLILLLALLYYKYSLRYIYSHVHTSETHGRLYPIALMHLYAGIYCLECSLIGIFFLVRDEYGKCSMESQGWMLICVLIVTIFCHIAIYNRYVKHFEFLPILKDPTSKSGEEHEANISTGSNENNHTSKVENELYSNEAMLYFHPAFKYEKPKIWLPDDPLCLCTNEIQKIASLGILSGGATRGATVSFNKTFSRLKINITQAPPDYK